MKILLLFIYIMLSTVTFCKQIETPQVEEHNKFAIETPLGWGYKTLHGDNGLIGVLWPRGTSFNDADTVIFVFVQNMKQISANNDIIPENLDIVRGKCQDLLFKFSSTDEEGDSTLSIGERYFSGRCGRTRIAFEERVGNYRIIVCLVSSFYVSSRIFNDARSVVRAYKEEVAKSEGITLEPENSRADNRNSSSSNQSGSATSSANNSSDNQMAQATMER